MKLAGSIFSSGNVRKNEKNDGYTRVGQSSDDSEDTDLSNQGPKKFKCAAVKNPAKLVNQRKSSCHTILTAKSKKTWMSRVLTAWLVLSTSFSATLLTFLFLDVLSPSCQTCVREWITKGKNTSNENRSHELDVKASICTSPGCVRAAAILLDSMDLSQNPCENFFQYACGNWLKNNPIPDDKSRYDAFTKVSELIKTKIRTLFDDENLSNTSGSKVIDFTRNVYQKSAIDDVNDRQILDYLNDMGGWPLIKPDWKMNKVDLTDLVIKAITIFSADTLFAINVDSDAKNVTNHILSFDQINLGLGYGTRDYYLNDTVFGKQIKAYKKLIADVARQLVADYGGQVDEAQLKADVEDLVNLERKIAELTVPEEDRRNATLQYNKRTLSQFNESFQTIHVVRLLKSVLPQEVYERLIDGDKMESYELIVKEPVYFEKYDSLIRNTDKRTVVNFAVWLTINSALSYLSTKYDDIVQNFNLVFRGVQQKPPRWKNCMLYTSKALPISLGSMFVRAFFSPDDKQVALDMIQHLKESFRNIIRNADWMDSETKKLSLEKADYIVDLIGYPDYAFNNTGLDEYHQNMTTDKNGTFLDSILSVQRWSVNKSLFDLLKHLDRKKFIVGPALVNAFYSPDRNAITFPAGILHPPFFHSSFPNYVNYGAMGSVIGHEITHGFDDQGRQFDKYGNLYNWWSEKSFEMFVKKKQCIIDQYDGYIAEDVHRHVNGKQTQGENIADNGGVKQSFYAYRKYVEKLGHPEPVLPGLNLTGEQLFFASYAQFWCGKMKRATRLLQLVTDAHSPEIFRIIGPLSNLKSFSSVFKCPAGSQMNPAVKCSVW